MEAVAGAQLHTLLDVRRGAVAGNWYRAMVHAGLVAPNSATLRQEVIALTDRVVELLLAEPFSEQAAQPVGTRLAQLPAIRPEVLGRSVNVLGQGLVGGFPAEDLRILQPRLTAVLGQIVTGFLREHDEAIRTQQCDIHRALVDARQQAEEARRAGEARYRAVVSAAAEGIVLVDARTACIVESNAAFQAMIGYGAEDLLGMPLQEIAVEGQESIDAGIRRTLRDGRRDVGERLCRRRDGTLAGLEVSATTIRAGSEVLLCIVARDMSERRMAQAELNEARRGIAAGREEERGRLARELHDSAMQTLIGLRYQMAAVRCADNPAKTIMRLEAEIAKVTSQLREVIGELRPPGLDEGGLRAALEHYIGRLPNADGSAKIDLDLSREAEALPQSLALDLFRVAQEAVRNALRHGRAERVIIQLRPRATAVILRVADNGDGFQVPDRPMAAVLHNHFGVSGMIERVEQLGGRLRIRSRLGRGTIVTAWAPLPAGSAWRGDIDDPGPAGG